MAEDLPELSISLLELLRCLTHPRSAQQPELLTQVEFCSFFPELLLKPPKVMPAMGMVGAPWIYGHPGDEFLTQDR